MNCPKYAAMGCYEASSFHRSYGSLGEGQVEDDYRGCSTFVLPVQDDQDEEAANCAAVEINGLAHQNCKRTCVGDSCNTHRLRNRHTCYQCTATVNSLGEEVAVGDSRCFENPSESSLVDCEEGQDYCMDELIIDWLPRGDQITRIVRGCSDRKAQTECQESDLPMTAYKDCEHSCTGDRCNNNFKVADKFYPSDRPTFECQGCNYVMQDDGSESGNTFCQEGTGQGYDKNLNMTCPIYAQIGCFTAASVHNFEGQDKYEIYKGCSTFPLKNNGIKEYTYENAGQEFQVTKTFCREDYDLEETYNGCNNEVLLPGNLEDQKAKQCYQCTVSVDQKNNTVGTGEQGCWNNPSERFLQWCNPGEYCATDLEIDWMSRGSMLYRLTRGCSDKKPEEEKPCLSGQTSLAQFKDCFVTCDTDECNGDKGDKCEGGKCGLNAVAELFSAGSEAVNECYTCSYSEDKSGNVNGEPFCGNTIEGEVTRVPLNACPVYANRACYQASSSHQDYAKPDSDFEEDYRGCSTFEHTNGEDFSCQTTTIEGLKHLNCKSSCKDNGCNTRGLVAGNTCYSCKVTLDSLYRPIGVGDIDCWGDVKDRHHVVCGDDQPYCTTELKVDWIGRGNQLYELSRGCSAVKPQEQCLETDSPQVKIKDCFDYCENGLNGGVDSCNDNVYEVAKKFRPDPEKPLEGFYQPGCFFCHYVEKDNGEVEGNVHCYDPEDASGGPLGFGPCPMHASTGCYTGSALHITPDGEEANEVYKGCSVFHFEHGIEKNQVELPVAGDKTLKYSTVKETCRGEGCNAPTTRPDDEQTETTTTTTTTTSTSTKSTEETPPPDNGGDGDNDNDGGDDGSSAMVASLIVLLASLML